VFGTPSRHLLPQPAQSVGRPTRVISRPSMNTSPAVGRSSRLRIRSRVLFPAPERPMMPKISPLLDGEDFTSRKAKNGPPGGF